MKTFVFIEKNGSGTLTLSETSYEEALEELALLVIEPKAWICENEEGENE